MAWGRNITSFSSAKVFKLGFTGANRLRSSAYVSPYGSKKDWNLLFLLFYWLQKIIPHTLDRQLFSPSAEQILTENLKVVVIVYPHRQLCGV